jgi:hypothetical protein
LKLIDFHLLLQAAQQHLFSVLGALASKFKTSSQPATGKPRLAATTRCLASLGSKTPEADASRPDLLGRLRCMWADWNSALMIVKTETVVAWHRKGFGLFWTWRIRRSKPGGRRFAPRHHPGAFASEATSSGVSLTHRVRPSVIWSSVAF